MTPNEEWNTKIQKYFGLLEGAYCIYDGRYWMVDEDKGDHVVCVSDETNTYITLPISDIVIDTTDLPDDEREKIESISI